VGSAALRDELEPRFITADAVVGVHRDENNVEYVQLHRLHRE
jgi:hypothetical protein